VCRTGVKHTLGYERKKETEMADLTQEQLIDHLSGMTVLQISELTKALEEKWGVKAAAGMGMPMMPMGAPGAPAAAPAEEQTEFDAILTSSGDKKIQVIKVVRELTGLGLKEAKDLVEGAPKPIKEKVSRKEADDIKAKITEAGGTVEIK
jgi:large subunit ribosomal protein L7/L12